MPSPARTALLLAVVLGLLLAGLTPAAAAPVRGTEPATAPADAATTVLLPTGDRVQLRAAPDGRPMATLLRSDPRDGNAFRTVRRNGDLFAYPAAAAPYLGRVLDPALFNVSQLARAGYTTAASRLPVRLTYRAGAAHHSIPGVTVTRTQGSTVDGYLAAAGARSFGQALLAQARADARAGWPETPQTGIFAGLTGFRYAGPAAAPPVQPRFPMFTLRIKVTGLDGQPAPFADLAVVNTDDARKFLGFPFLIDGEARISVPAGHYGLLAVTTDFGDEQITERIVNVSDYEVRRAQTLALDMRTATEPVQVTTPRPATLTDGSFDWLRLDPNGGGVGFGAGFGQGVDLRVDPGRPARFGTLAASVSFHLESAPTEPEPYLYDLKFGEPDRIPASLTFHVTDADVAALDSRYHADGPRFDPFTLRFAFLPWDQFGFAVGRPLALPTQRLEYLSAGQVMWSDVLIGIDIFDFSDPENPFFFFGAEIDDTFRRYQGGSQRTVDWAQPPLRPVPDFDPGTLPAGLQFGCPFCRRGDTLGLVLTPVGDSTPGHFGWLDSPGDTPLGPVVSTTRLRLFSGDVLLADEADVRGVAVEVPAGSQPYQLVFDETRTAPWYTQGTRSHTEWTFTSARPTAPAVPDGWQCIGDTGDCAVQPLLTLGYAAPVDLAGQVPPGASHLGVTVAPTQGAPATAIATVSVEVSFDDGQTWSPATVTGSGGRYDAAFTAPASGFVSTRVRATDAAGNSIAQTVLRAYAIGAAA